MKTIISFKEPRFWGRVATRLIGLVLCACSAAAPRQRPVTSSEADAVRRLASILDYVAADYGAAVVAGQVANEFEYKEQLAFVGDAHKLVGKIASTDLLPAADLDREIAAIEDKIVAKAHAEDVAKTCRTLRKRLLEAHGVVLAPTAPPVRERGAELFAQACVSCHGASGRGDGREAARLKPPPRSFHNVEVMDGLTPVRVFNALTDGVEGTAMASFGTYPAADRWSLAFYVFGLRYDEASAQRGRAAFEKAGRPLAVSATRLAGTSDQELRTAFAGAGLSGDEPRDAVAHVRRVAAYETSGARLLATRELLGQALASYRAGDAAQASQGVGRAYLDGFEPHEGALKARDPELVTRVEERFLRLREDFAGGVDLAQAEREVLFLGALIDRAEERLAGGGGARVAFVSALLVMLREGLEAALLVLLLLGLAKRAGAARDVRSVHLGWLVALAAGGATWFASGPILQLGGARREIVEGVVALIAAVVLLFAGHYVLARLDARRRVEALKRRFQAASPARRRVLLIGLAVVAVYREAFEIVLFLRAILLDANASAAAVGLGALAGVLGCVVVVVLLGGLGRRLNPGPLLTASGSLLCVLAFILAGKGVRALQEAGVLGIFPLPVPRVEWLGLFPTLQSVGAQLFVLLAFAGIMALSYARERRQAA